MLAPMGIAAIKVEGATINSFFHFPPKIIDNRNIFPDRKRQELFKRLEMIIIDEVSMVRADIIDGIDYSLRINRQNNAPFGGVQMIFFGDLYQLAPVIVGNGLKQYFERHYGGVYFFNARVFTKLDFQYLELQIIFRQKDEQFKNILNSVRENKISASELAVLNKQYQPGHTYEENDLHLTLTATNKVMESINRERMENQPGKEYRFQAIITGNMDPSSYPTDPVLVLKQGAQIMLLKNDSKKRWVNGSLGRISQISNSAIWVEINGSSYFLERANWEVIEYAYNSKEKKIDAVVKGSFSQFPIQAAWAMTIHKSQGQTFNSIVIDLGNGAVSHGQTYVALSRCTSLEKIILKSPIRKRDIILDENVKQFIHSKTGNKKAR